MDKPLTPEQVAAARARRLDYQHDLLIEGNPLTAEELEMFEMFDREGWSHERCRAYILARFGAGQNG